MRNLKVTCAILVLFASSQVLANAQNTKFYGYINAYTEDVDDQPIPGGAKDESEQTYEVPNINAIVQSDFNNFKTYLNLTTTHEDPMEVSNAWVQSDLMGDHLSIRFGKLYRRFGLYNEILDAVPTYIGIEPPELYDSDHLLLTRTTNLMLFGKHELGPGYLNYAFMTGADERKEGERPFGIDVNYQIGTKWKFGASYYDTNGKAVSGTEYSNGGKGKPNGGVMPWMDEDEFTATGVYLQYIDTHWTVQVAGYSAPHKGVRNTAAITDLCANYGSALTTVTKRSSIVVVPLTPMPTILWKPTTQEWDTTFTHPDGVKSHPTFSMITIKTKKQWV